MDCNPGDYIIVDITVSQTQLGGVATAAGRHRAGFMNCRFDNASAGLRPGMTGHARIYTRPGTVGSHLLHRTMRLLGTEFWWQVRGRRASAVQPLKSSLAEGTIAYALLLAPVDGARP